MTSEKPENSIWRRASERALDLRSRKLLYSPRVSRRRDERANEISTRDRRTLLRRIRRGSDYAGGSNFPAHFPAGARIERADFRCEFREFHAQRYTNVRTTERNRASSATKFRPTPAPARRHFFLFHFTVKSLRRARERVLADSDGIKQFVRVSYKAGAARFARGHARATRTYEVCDIKCTLECISHRRGLFLPVDVTRTIGKIRGARGRARCVVTE